MTVSEADALLASYYEFEESILLGVWSSNLLRDYHAIISAARDESGKLREDLGRNVLMMSFRSCQSLAVKNDFDSRTLSDEANWGLSEFAALRVSQAADNLLAFRFDWEGSSRYIEIVCASTSITTDVKEIYGVCGKWLDDARSILL